MSQQTREISRNPPFAWNSVTTVLLVFNALLVGLIYFYQYEIFEDGICYLSLARLYLKGDVADAINAYWSPLYSWLLTPLIALPVPILLVPKLLTPFIGSAAIIAMWQLGQRVGLLRSELAVLCYAIIPLLLYAAVDVTSPDLLSAAVMLWYIVLVCRTYSPGLKSSVILGATGALAYFAKAYLLWFFFAHLTLCTLLQLKEAGDHRITIVRNWVISLGVCIAISAPWIVAISFKCHRLTTSSAGAYNLALDTPYLPGDTVRRVGLFELPNPDAISAWENPADYPPPAWNPLGSWRSVRWEANHVLTNLERLTILITQLSPLALVGYAAVPYLLFRMRKSSIRLPVQCIIAAIVLYPLGYLPFHLYYRFISGLLLLLILLTVLTLRHLPGSNLRVRRIAAVLFILACAVEPAQMLYARRNFGLRHQQEAVRLQIIPEGSRIASDSSWDITFFLAFIRNLHFIGMINTNETPRQWARDLNEFRVDYLIVYSSSTIPRLDRTWIKVNGPDPDVAIYRVPLNNLPH